MNLKERLDIVLGSYILSKEQRIILEIRLVKKLQSREPDDITIRELKGIIQTATNAEGGGAQRPER